MKDEENLRGTSKIFWFTPWAAFAVWSTLLIVTMTARAPIPDDVLVGLLVAVVALLLLIRVTQIIKFGRPLFLSLVVVLELVAGALLYFLLIWLSFGLKPN